jgi:hypothetical protein
VLITHLRISIALKPSKRSGGDGIDPRSALNPTANNGKAEKANLQIYGVLPIRGRPDYTPGHYSVLLWDLVW